MNFMSEALPTCKDILRTASKVTLMEFDRIAH